MIRIIKLLLLGTVLFHIVRATYVENTLEQKIQNICVVLGRMQKTQNALEAFKKEETPALKTLGDLSKGYGAIPKWNQP